MRDLVIMFSKKVFAEVAIEIALNGMDMIGIILSVVVLEEEGRALYAIIMRFSLFGAAGPTEVDFIQSGFGDLREVLASEIRPNPLDVVFNETQQSCFRSPVHVSGSDADLFERFDLSLRFGNDFLGSGVSEDRLF